MKKRLIKKVVATVVLAAMLLQTGFEDYSMLNSVYAAENNAEQPIVVDASAIETPASESVEVVTEPATPESESIDIVVQQDDSNIVANDSELDVESLDGGSPVESKEVFDDKAIISGVDDVTLHIITGQMNTEDRFTLKLTGPVSMLYDSAFDYSMDKFSQGTYYIENLNKGELVIEVDEFAGGMAYEFSILDNGDVQIELVSAPEEEVEKVLDAHSNSVTGSGYDYITVYFVTDDLDDDIYFNAEVLTEADARYNGDSLANNIIPSLSNRTSSITIDNLDKKEFEISLIGDNVDDIVADYTVEDLENGILNVVVYEGEKEKEESTKRIYTYEDSKVSVTATLEVIDAIPDDADFVVTEVSPSSSGYNYDAYMEALNNNSERIVGESGDEDRAVFNESNTLLYDIAFFAYDEDGNYVELQPEEGSVRISIRFKKDQLEEEIGASEDQDITIVHLPLTDSVKESVDSTADATGISSSDVNVEVVADSASVDSESANFTLSDFSVTAIWANGKLNINPGTDVTFESALGNARYFGVTANTMALNGHMETNFATGTLSGNANINSCKNDGKSGGETYIGAYTGSGFTMDPGSGSSSDILIYTTPGAYSNMGFNMTNGRSHVVVNTTKYTEEQIKAKVSDLVTTAQANSTTIAGYAAEYGYDFFDVAMAPSTGGEDADKYILDIASLGTSDSGTYYINFRSGKFSTIGHYVIKMKENQRVVFNIPDTSVSFDQFSYQIGDGKQTTTSGDAVDDAICQRLIFNCPNATTTKTVGPTAGCFLVPYSDFCTEGVAAGWVVANTISKIGGQEWHCVWHDMPEPDPTSCSFVIKGTKTVDGSAPGANRTFTFGLYDWDGTNPILEGGNPVTVQNDANGLIQFPEFTFSGDYRNARPDKKKQEDKDTQAFGYVIKEIPGEDGVYNYSKDWYRVVIYVHTDANRVNSVTSVRIEKKTNGEGNWTSLGGDNSWSLFETKDYVAFNNESTESKPDSLELNVKKTFEGDWDSDTQVKVTIEKFKMSGIEDVPDEIWNQIPNKTITLTPQNPTGSFGTITFNADHIGGYSPNGGSPEGTVKYHVYMFKITESLVVADSSVESDIATGLGYTVAVKGVRYLKVFINTVTKDYRVYEAKVSAQVKGNTNTNTDADKCQGYPGYIEFVNKRTTGKISLIKEDANTQATMDGVTFRLYDSNNNAVKVSYDAASKSYKYDKKSSNLDLVTANGGSITVTGLVSGNYYFKEISTPAGYAAQTDATYSFSVDNKGVVTNKSVANASLFTFASAVNTTPATYTVKNTPKKGFVEIEKVSSTGAKLTGVVFDLYKDGSTTVYKTLTTDANGYASANDLEWGSYVMKERAFDGYVQNTTEYAFTINANNLSKSFTGNSKIVNTPISGNFKLVKTSDNKPLAGASFKIKNGSKILKFSAASGKYVYDENGTTDTLVTDSKGEVFVSNLPYGTYNVVEVNAPTGYVLKSSDATTFIIDKNDETEVVNITNDKVSAKVKFFKTDSSDKGILPGATFELRKYSGDSYTVVSTKVSAQKSGEVSFEDLGIGSYAVVETKAPDGYEYNASSPLTIKFDVTADDNGKTIYLDNTGRVGNTDADATKANVTNDRKDGSVELEKVSDAGAKLAGVTFDLYTSDNKIVKVDGSAGVYTYNRTAAGSSGSSNLVTDSNGKIKITGLPWGSYYFKETKGIAGFTVNSSATYAFTINGTNVADTTYTGTKAIVNETVKGYVRLVKVDADDADTKLKGVKFNLYKSDKKTLVISGLETDGNGTITYGPLDYGTYYFLEQETVAGYTFTNGQYLEVKVTENGDANSAASVTATNTRKPGSITLTKTDAATGNALAGAQFELYSTNGTGLIKTVQGWFNGSWTKYSNEVYTTDANGVITVNNLPWGQYKFKEVKAPEGYELPADEASRYTSVAYIGVNSETESLTVSLSASNTPYRGKIELVKTDANDSSKKLSGGKFELYKSDNTKYSDTVYSLTDGKITVDNLPFGSYYFLEIEAPVGYVTPTGDAAKSTVATITTANVVDSAKTPITATLSNTEIKGGFELKKVDGNGATLKGATFKLYSDAQFKNQIKVSGSAGVYTYSKDGSLDEMVTSDAGVLKVTNIPYGEYYVKEIKAPAGYEATTTSAKVTINSDNQLLQFNFVNTLIQAGVRFYKADMSSYETVLTGATFELYMINADGTETDLGAIAESSTTGLYERTGLGVGNYYIIETKAPTGYKMNTVVSEGNRVAKKYTFSVTASDNGKIVSLDNPDNTFNETSYIYNEKLLGSARIKKVGSDTAHADGLAGAEFALYKKGEKTAYKTGLVSGTDGYVEVTDLPWGDYYFQETAAPTGYALSTEKYEFTIDKDNLDVTLSKTAVNDYILGAAKITKLAWDTLNNKATNEKLSGAIFDLYYDNNAETPEIVTGYEDGLVSDKNGVVITRKDLPLGNYYFLERVAPEGYEKSNEKITFSVTEENYTEEYISPASNGGKVYNRRKLGKAKLFKYETENNVKVGLSGAVFELYMDDAVLGMIDKKIGDTYTADSNGIVSVENLEWGTYYFKEKTPPTGYEANTTKVYFTISASNLDVEKNAQGEYICSLENTPIKGAIKLVKTDSASGAKLAGAKFELHKVVGTTDTVLANSADSVNGYYTTDAKGEITVENLDWATYYFIEKEAPEGYVTPTGSAAITESIVINASNTSSTIDASKTIDFTNDYAYGNVQITKVDDKNVALKGAQFELYTYDSATQKKLSRVYVTGSAGTYVYSKEVTSVVMETPESGIVKVTGLPFGTYAFIETVAPTGFVKSANDYIVRVTANQSADAAVLEAGAATCVNSTLSASAVLYKAWQKDASTVEALSGVEFKLYKSGVEAAVDTQYSDENGMVRFSGLGEGTYVVKETATPNDAYSFDPTKELYTFTVTHDDDGKEFALNTAVDPLINMPKPGSASIIKYYREGQVTAPLAGVTFNLYRGTKAEDGTITYADTVVDSQKTDANGACSFNNLSWGYYMIKEDKTNLPSGITGSDEEYTFEINADKLSEKREYTFYNDRQSGDLEIEKIDADTKTALTGGTTTFVLTGPNNYSETLVVNASGKATASGLQWGTYTLVETVAETGYVKDGTERTFTIDGNNLHQKYTNNNAIENEKIKGNVKLEKADSRTKKAMSGVTFKLYKDLANGSKQLYTDASHVDGLFVTDAKGELQIEGLTYGNYHFEEVTPEGYEALTTEQLNKLKFSIKTDGEWITFTGNNKVVNTPESGKVRLSKVVTGTTTPIEGAVFSLYASEPETYGQTISTLFNDGYYFYGEYTTNAEGIIEVSGLPWQKYYFVEQNKKGESGVPAGYSGNPNAKIEFEINSQNCSAELSFSEKVENTPLLGSAKLTKVDNTKLGGDNKALKLAGAKFHLYMKTVDAEGKEVAQDITSSLTEAVDGSLVTNAAGIITVSNLAWGDYYFVETVAPEGYDIECDADGNPKKYPFSISAANYSVTNSIMTPSEVIVNNNEIYGYVSLQKRFVTADGELDSAVTDLSGIAFEILGSDKSTVVKSNLVTDKDGKISAEVIGKLPFGKYYFHEVSLPQRFVDLGYTLNTADVAFVIDSTNTAAQANVAPYNFDNSSVLGAAKLLKKDSVSGNGIKGIVFDLYYADGTLKESITAFDNGVVKAEGLVIGSYYFQENQASAEALGYVYDDTKYEFEITKEDRQKVVEVNGVKTLEWQYVDLGTVENNRRKGSLKLIKNAVNSAGTKSVIKLDKDCEARFELYKVGESTPVLTADEVYALYNDEGVVIVNDLDWGTYYFKETVAPKGYSLPENPNTNQVVVNGESISSTEMPVCSITDDTLRLFISKVEVGGNNGLKDATLSIYKLGDGVLGQVSTYGEKIDSWTTTLTPHLVEVGGDAKGLEAGVQYVLREEASPAGYSVTNDFIFTIDSNGVVTTSARKSESASGTWTIFVEDKPIELYIDKKALGTTTDLQGATLRIMHGEDVVDSWITTGESHKVSQSSVALEVGESYVLEETNAPEGYYTADPITFKVLADGRIVVETDKSGTAKVDDKYENKVFVGSTLTMFDKPIKLVVSKKRLTGSDTDYVVGAKLSIYKYANDTKGDLVYSWTSTGEDEEIPFGKLVAGEKYIIIETEAPAGYIVSDPVIFTVKDHDPKAITDAEGLVPQKVVVNDKLVVAKFSKKALGGTTELAGATLQLYDSVNTKLAEWTTNDKPYVVTSVANAESLSDSEKAMYEGYNVIYGVDLKVGQTYKLVEKEAPYGYAKADTITFTIGEDGLPCDISSGSLTNGIVTMFDPTDEKFYTHLDGTKKWLLFRDKKGNIIPGKTYKDVTIYLTQSVDGSAPTRDIDLDGDGVGDGEISVTIANGAIESNGTKTFILGQKDGKDILPTKDRSGNEYTYGVYEVGDGTYEPTISMATLNAVITNTPVVDPFRISGVKKWVDPVGTARPGIKIELWRDGKLFKETELKADYTFEFADLWEYNFGLGEGEDKATADGHKFEYEIKETGAEGYDLEVDFNGVKQTVVPDPKDGVVNVTLTNTYKQKYIEIRGTKFWDDRGNSATRPAITVVLDAEDSTGKVTEAFDTYVILPNSDSTYSFGTAGRKKLPKYDEVGGEIKYTVREIIPDGYFAPEYTTVPTNDENKIVINIKNTPSKIVVSKQDATNAAELPGAVMAIYDSKGVEVTRWTSTTTRHYVEGLTIGATYTLREISAPRGYALADPVEFTVGAAKTEQLVVMEDPRIVGSVRLTKLDSETRETLSGAVFNLYTSSGALVSAVGTAGSYEYVSGSASTSLVVNGEGTLTVTGLPYGEYYFREVSAPTGYALSTETAYCTIDAMGAEASVTFLNTKLRGRARLTKISSADSSPLAGATFELYSKTPRTAGQAVGGTLFSDVYYLYGTYVTDASGTITVGDLPWDDYYFIETEAPAGYVLDVAADGTTPVYTFSIDAGAASARTVVDLGSITNTPGGGGGGGGAAGGGGAGGGGVAGVRRLPGSGVGGVLGVRSAPTSGVLGVRVGPTTGDASSIALWLVLMLASVSVIVAIFISAGKKRKVKK